MRVGLIHHEDSPASRQVHWARHAVRPEIHVNSHCVAAACNATPVDLNRGETLGAFSVKQASKRSCTTCCMCKLPCYYDNITIFHNLIVYALYLYEHLLWIKLLSAFSIITNDCEFLFSFANSLITRSLTSSATNTVHRTPKFFHFNGLLPDRRIISSAPNILRYGCHC